MLIIKKRDKSEPATFTYPFREQEITLTVRPLDDEIQKIIKKHTRYVMGVHPDTKEAVRIAEVNNRGVGEDVIAHLLVDFSGLGLTPDEPLEVTRENKLLIAGLKVEEGENGGRPVYLSDIIQAKAKELAAVVEFEEKEQAKNSGGAPA